MGREFVCDCGTVVRAKSAKQTIRCPKCGNLLNYGEAPEESADSGRAASTADGSAANPSDSYSIAEPTTAAGYGFIDEPETRADDTKNSVASGQRKDDQNSELRSAGYGFIDEPETRADDTKNSPASGQRKDDRNSELRSAGYGFIDEPETRADDTKNSPASGQRKDDRNSELRSSGYGFVDDPETRAEDTKNSVASGQRKDDRNSELRTSGYGFIEEPSSDAVNGRTKEAASPAETNLDFEKPVSRADDFILRSPPKQSGVFEPEAARYGRKTKRSKTVVDPDEDYGTLQPPPSRRSQNSNLRESISNSDAEDADAPNTSGSYGFDVNSSAVAPRPNESIFQPEVPTEPLVNAASVFEADPAHDPFLEETDEQRRARRKRPQPPDPEDSLRAGWRAWINPEGLLWLPILVPCFSIATGVIAAGLGSKIGTATGMQVSPFMTVFGTMLSIPFGCFMILHFSEIIGAWALGTKTDPEWPDIVATGMVMQTFLLIFAILSGALMSMVIAAPLYYMLGPETNAAWKTAGIVIAIGTFFYAPIAWLACVLWEDWRAANPMIVLGAIFRLNSRLVKFYVEVFVHFVVIVVLASVALPAFAASAILGGIVWIAFWTFTLLSGARLSRALGIVYAEHFRLLGWFT